MKMFWSAGVEGRGQREEQWAGDAGERLELGHHEFDQLAFAIGRQEVEGMDGEANVSRTINDYDVADDVVKVLAILMQTRNRHFPVGRLLTPTEGMKCWCAGKLIRNFRTGAHHYLQAFEQNPALGPACAYKNRRHASPEFEQRPPAWRGRVGTLKRLRAREARSGNISSFAMNHR
jgi:hypothetical protein